MTAFLHAVGTAVPDHDVHRAYLDWAAARLEARPRALFERMAARAGIRHRWSVLPPKTRPARRCGWKPMPAPRPSWRSRRYAG